MLINVGGEFFDEIRRDGSYYVDKTEILYELVAKTKNKVTLFTRPRRFGKTLMLNMMENFFDIRKDSEKYFEGLAVAEHKEFCEEYRNQYPVMALSLKRVDALNFEEALDSFRTVISTACVEHAYLAEDKQQNPIDLEVFGRLMMKKSSVEPESVKLN